MPPGSRDLRVVPDLPHRTVRHILNRIICRARLRNFNTTCWLTSSEEGMSVGIADLGAVDDQRVIVKTRNQRRSGNRPESVLLLLHVNFRAAPEVQSDLRSVRSFHANLYSPGAVNPWILRCPDVRGRGLKIIRLLCPTKTQRQEDQYCKSPHVFLLRCH